MLHFWKAALVGGFIVAGWITAVFPGPSATQGQEIQHHHHEGASLDVDRFYSTWKMTYVRKNGIRIHSCCNKKDCHPAMIRFNQGRWEGRYMEGPFVSDQWLHIPDEKLEENAPDPRESPDGQSHMCGSQFNVYCAVRGAGL